MYFYCWSALDNTKRTPDLALLLTKSSHNCSARDAFWKGGGGILTTIQFESESTPNVALLETQVCHGSASYLVKEGKEFILSGKTHSKGEILVFTRRKTLKEWIHWRVEIEGDHFTSWQSWWQLMVANAIILSYLSRALCGSRSLEYLNVVLQSSVCLADITMDTETCELRSF